MPVRFLIAFAIAAAIHGGSAHAATFTVNSYLDIADQTPADGLCQTPAGLCTLRAAIQQANALPGADTILLPGGIGIYKLTLTGTGEDLAATGDLDVTDSVTIQGDPNVHSWVSGETNDRVFHVTNPAAVVTIEALRITGGATSSDGAGISNFGNLTLKNCLVHGNQLLGGTGGGGIANFGTLSVLDSEVFDNGPIGAVVTLGGGILTKGNTTIRRTSIHSNTSFGGGGIWEDSSAVMEITDSLISFNTCSSGTGGGLEVVDAEATLVNTTVSHNSAAVVGGILALTGKLNLNNVTITANSSTSGPHGGGLDNYDNGEVVTVSNTIIAGNIGPASNPDCGGALFSAGFNLIGSTTGCTITGDPTGNLVGISANLGPLASNGGPTNTHLLLPGSQAIDHGNNVLPVGSGGSACAVTDQRLGPRALDGDGNAVARCDIGAVEVGCGNRFVENAEFCYSPCCNAACTGFLPAGSSCEEGDLCTAGDTCDNAGTCIGGAAVTCDPCSACDSGQGCIPALPVGSPCEDGDQCTVSDTCDNAGTCVAGPPVTCDACEVCDSSQGCIDAAPAAGCRITLGPKKAFFSLKPGKTAAKNVVLWKWGRGQQTMLPDFGDPFGATAYDLCVYDGSEALMIGAHVPSSNEQQMCGLFPCWKQLANGNVKYKNKGATPQGITLLTLAPGPDAKAKIGLKGKGTNLSFPTLPLPDPNLRVQLRQVGGPSCWDASFSANVLKNKSDGYTAQSD